MNAKKKEADLPAVSNISHIATRMKRRTSLAARFDLCECQPLALREQEGGPVKEDLLDREQMVLVSRSLHTRLHTLLDELFPRTEPLTLLIVHMSQLEPKPLAPHSNLLYRRHHYHVPPGLLEQVIANVQRVIRIEDELLLHEDVGFALVFPDVDQQGAQIILERVYSSICLLQAETLIPPLTRETTIAVGVGSYPAPSPSLDTLCRQADRIAHSLVLRPIITTQLQGVKPMPSLDDTRLPVKAGKEEVATDGDATSIPFMDLPCILPTRLTQLIPFEVAIELQCAPVGRDHHYLTVAMRDPTDSTALRRLQRITGMTIFPVSCEASALSSLLTRPW